ncbi:serine hydrolase domain-containing protein [Luteimonas sp. SDU82]|uniref:serine hydrolase domain-containing protein n=1 Tax=Luteimonas sp. SDU82 TaxID=3422592 RepID=UPI003EBD6EE2
MSPKPLRILFLFAAWSACLLAAAADRPADAGSDAWLREAVLDPGYPGARLLIATDEAVLVDLAAGHADIARTRPLPPDAIYRIHSMTKPIVSAAALRLIGEGHARLDDPVATHLPALGGLRVLDDGQLREPARPVTVRHLLTHTAGFAIGAGEALQRREAAQLERSRDLADLVERLRGVPLERDPGTAFVYDGLATDVLGRLVEVWSGQLLDAYLQATFFDPLGMRDTGFSVPEARRHRLVELSRMGADGRLAAANEPPGHVPGTALRPYPSAAGGLYSTAADYLAFARMLLARGRHGEDELVPARLVAEMLRDQLAPLGLSHPWIEEGRGRGFGLGLSVLLDPRAIGRSGAPGQAGWTGSASTYFVLDQARGGIGILMLQHLPGEGAHELPRVALPFYNYVQQVLAQ